MRLAQPTRSAVVRPAGQVRAAVPVASQRMVRAPGQHRLSEASARPRTAQPVAYGSAHPRPHVAMPAPPANPFLNWFTLR
ncbi:hypothetical protein ABTJ99_19775, partial [Acinetobacter baumannii]